MTMQFIKTVTSSIFDPAFYRQARTQSLAPAVKTLIALGAIGIGLMTVFVYALLIPFALSDFPNKVVAAYPDDLVVTVAQGELSTNQPQPYYIKDTLFESDDPETPKYLVIFDTDDTLDPDPAAYSTLAIIKSKYIVTADKDSGARITSFSNIEATSTVAKSDVIAMAEKVRPYIAPVLLGGGALLFILGITVGAVTWAIMHMLYLLAPALIVFLIMLTRSTRLTYRESYLVALYASIPVAIMSYLLSFVWPMQPPLLYTIALVVIALINTLTAHNVTPTPTS